MIDESMENETLKEPETLEILAEKITRYANEADEKTLEAAKLILEARELVDAGEAATPIGRPGRVKTSSSVTPACANFSALPMQKTRRKNSNVNKK